MGIFPKVTQQAGASVTGTSGSLQIPLAFYFMFLKNKQISPISWFTPQLPEVAKAEPSLGQERGFQSRCPTQVAGIDMLDLSREYILETEAEPEPKPSIPSGCFNPYTN